MIFGRKKRVVRVRRKAPVKKWDFESAVDVKEMIAEILRRVQFAHVQFENLYFVRSQSSRARAYARIWGLSRIFQATAGFPPTYVIEVISEHFDKLSHEEQIKVLLHELLHIPKTFSGSLKSHKGRYHRIDDHEVEGLFSMYKQSKVTADGSIS